MKRNVFLHVGNNKNIRIRDVVGIFDMDNATVSSVTRKYLSHKQKSLSVESAAEDIPKSFILADKGKFKKKEKNKKKESEIILCKFSSGVLFGRIDNEQSLTAQIDDGDEDL